MVLVAKVWNDEDHLKPYGPTESPPVLMEIVFICFNKGVKCLKSRPESCKDDSLDTLFPISEQLSSPRCSRQTPAVTPVVLLLGHLGLVNPRLIDTFQDWACTCCRCRLVNTHRRAGWKPGFSALTCRFSSEAAVISVVDEVSNINIYPQIIQMPSFLPPHTLYLPFKRLPWTVCPATGTSLGMLLRTCP